MVKRLYHAMAWLAMANLFAVAGLIAYLFASGHLNAERVDQMAMVMRGEFPKPQPPVASQPVVVQEKPQTSREELAKLEAQKQFYTLISERHQREIDDRKNLNQTIQMDVNRQLEQIEARTQEFEKEKKKTKEALEQSGFQQVLDIYSEMEPKLAKDVLITKKDPDVVQLFIKMDSGKRKKIVNTCKTPEEKAWVGRILTAIGKMDEMQLPPPVDDKAGTTVAGNPPVTQ